jgi:Tfp pilus assembly protein PilX
MKEANVEDKSISFKIKNLAFRRLVKRLVSNERGMALIFALLLMLVVSIIGSSAIMTSQVDLKMSGNTKVIRTSFYVAEGGIQLAPKVISQIITNRALPALADTPLLTYDTDNLLDKIMGYIKDDDPGTDTTDIVMNQGTQGDLALDVSRTRTEFLSGGGVEFAAGTEGVGVSGATSTAVHYNFTSTGTVGTAPRVTVAQIASQYRKVIGVAGGR